MEESDRRPSESGRSIHPRPWELMRSVLPVRNYSHTILAMINVDTVES